MCVSQPECVFVDLGTRHEMCMRHIVVYPAPLYNIFQHYLINSTIFEKSYRTYRESFEFLLTFFKTFFSILRRTERDMLKNVYRS
jgi:hypothetical protein